MNDKGRRDLSFSLEDDKQKLAYQYLGMLGRSQSSFVSSLICDFLHVNGLDDVTQIEKEDAKNLAIEKIKEKKVQSRSTINDTNLVLMELLNTIKGFASNPGESASATTSPLSPPKSFSNQPSFGIEQNHANAVPHEEIEEDEENDILPDDDNNDESEEANSEGIDNDLLGNMGSFFM